MVFLLSDGENVIMMVGNFILDFFKEARLGSMIKIPKLGLGSGSTLEARARLGLEKFGLVPPLIYHTQEYDTFTGLIKVLLRQGNSRE